jgi:hypothetical protein
MGCVSPRTQQTVVLNVQRCVCVYACICMCDHVHIPSRIIVFRAFCLTLHCSACDFTMRFAKLCIVYEPVRGRNQRYDAGTLAWLNNFLSRSGSLRAQLQALQGVKDFSAFLGVANFLNAVAVGPHNILARICAQMQSCPVMFRTQTLFSRWSRLQQWHLVAADQTTIPRLGTVYWACCGRSTLERKIP